MEKTGWKILGMIILILFLIENLFFFLAISYAEAEEEKTYECYYEICKDYPDAEREGDLCHCYDFDLLEQLTLVKTEYMK